MLDITLGYVAAVLLSLLACRPINRIKVRCACDWSPKGSLYEGRWMDDISHWCKRNRLTETILTASVIALLPFLVCVITWLVTMIRLHNRSCLVYQLKRVGGKV